MLIWHQSAAGTIRDSNQERWHLEEDLGLLILADGDGPAGNDLADLAIVALGRCARRLLPGSDRMTIVQTDKTHLHDHAQTTPLSEILESSWQEIELARVAMAGGASSNVHLAVAWVHQGCLFAGTLGRTGLIASVGGRIHRIEPAGLPTLAVATGVTDAPAAGTAATPVSQAIPRYIDPVPVTVGDWVMVCSQGILLSQPISEILPMTPLIHEDPERLTEALFRKASGRYDGDDRTLVLARFLPSDITRNMQSGRIISTDIDRRFRMPLWVPLLISAALAFIYALTSRHFTDHDE